MAAVGRGKESERERRRRGAFFAEVLVVGMRDMIEDWEVENWLHSRAERVVW